MFAAQYHIDHTTKQNVRFTKQNVSNLSTRTKTRIKRLFYARHHL
nr:MAG TPA: hypothetical protein [Caudoviricetes sp.]